MCTAIDNPASCENHAVIFILHAKNIIAAEICCELSVVCGQKIVSEGTVTQ
jgi:hypothetical protein